MIETRAFVLAALLLVGFGAHAEYNGEFPRRAATPAANGRIIVGLRQEAASPRAAAVSRASTSDRVSALAVRTGIGLRGHRALSPSMEVIEVDEPAQVADTIARLEADPDVAFAEPDGRVYRHAVPNDPLFTNQWYLRGVEAAATNAEAAWDTTSGAPDVVVAVLDTGALFDHPDLLQSAQGGRFLPGYDFVGPDPGGTFHIANDGDGWDANASDPGDWVTVAENQTSLFAGCGVSDSSWHGTRVAGIIGAIANNATGISGGTWSGFILPVRVLGKCFGENSDIIAGLRWAAGLHVDGVPDNPTPARIINMSLGAPGNCTASYRTVIAELAQIGALVVASAGNSDGPVEYPGNCAGVAAVAGLRHIGTKVGYSSFGAQVTVAAPGGNCVNDPPGACLFSLDTTANTGTTVPVSPTYTDQINDNVGTSFSAPQVAAIAALMESVNGSLDGPHFINRLRNAARPFPPFPSGIVACRVGAATGQFGCGCTTTTCGAGIADAPGSVAEALRPIADVTATSTGSFSASVDGASSTAADGRSIASYDWAVVCGTDVTLTGTAGSPQAGASSPGTFVLSLTVTDDEGDTDTSDVTVKSASATVAPLGTQGTCASASSGGGGGGSLGWSTLALLALGLRRPRRSARRGA